MGTEEGEAMAEVIVFPKVPKAKVSEQTKAAIKAAVDQYDKVHKGEEIKEIKRRNEIRNEAEFNLLKEWVQKKEKQWLK